MKQRFTIEGMSCSACQAAVEKAVGRIKGVRKADVSLLNNSMLCEFTQETNEQTIISAVEKAGFSASVADSKADDTPQAHAQTQYTDIRVRLTVSIIFLMPLLYASMGHMFGLPFTHILTKPQNSVNYAFLQFLLTLPVLYVNRVFFFKGFKALFNGSANMDSLVAVGSAASMLYGIFAIFMSGYYSGNQNITAAAGYSSNLYFESAAMILTLVTVGKFLEQNAKGKTNEALKKLIKLKPSTVRVIRNGEEQVIDSSALVRGDIIALRPGESVPADGVIVEGSSSLDQSAITGESIPVDKTAGDKVISASVNLDGFIKIKAEAVGSESTLSKIISLVEEAGASKAKSSKLADKISGIFVPIVMSIAAVTFIVWLVNGKGAEFALNMAISVLVISCPCSLGLATPVAVTAAIGRSASKGILVKSAAAIETLKSVDTVVFDKTGTLTKGVPSATDIIPAPEVSKEQLIKIAASIEKGSEHPLARAVSALYEDEPYELEEFKAVFGKGVYGVISGARCCGGNKAYMEELSIDISVLEQQALKLAAEGKTPLYFSKGNQFLGIIAVSDTLRESSVRAISQIKSIGLQTVMLTGDNSVTANAIKEKLGIDQVVSDVLPQDKEAHIRELLQNGHTAAMVGDGINDSPALSRASVGIAVSNGSDIAIDSADIILMKNDITDVYNTIIFSRYVMRNIKQNLFWAFFYNTIGIPIAAGVLFVPFGITLSPMLAAAAMSLSSLFVVLNALRLYRK